MKFALEVSGDLEKFNLEYEFNQLLGTLVIRIDNEEVKRRRKLFNEPVREVLDLALGKQEMISVRIEKERKFLFGQRNKVYINDRLVKTYEGI